ncbi:MAG: hypothetical protein GY719_35420 [bacterium]|nr:hypothetical protein [bacterium]
MSFESTPATPIPVRPATSLTAALLVAGLILPLLACGKKGNPLPPLRNIPLTTSDLEVRQQGRQILLDMAYPSVTVSGMTLGGIDSVELQQLIKPAPSAADPAVPLPSADAREFEAGAQSLLTLRGTELAAAVVGDRIQFRLPLAEDLPAEPVANIFAVRTSKGDETSSVSNRVTLVPTEPPPAPGNLQVAARAGGIEVSWEADEDPVSFDVFRREAQIRGYGDAVKRVKGENRTYLDRSARYDRRYIYTVRAVASLDPVIHSDQGGEREIEYEDRFAPPLPKNLVALAERASIRLRWDPSAADDVVGYVIYRREPSRNFHRITDEPVASTEYLDRNLASGLTYAYRIQVIDREGNESELSAPVETTAR